MLKADEKYRITDLNSLPSDIRSKVVSIMMSPEAKEALGRVDASIAKLDENDAAALLSSIYREIADAVKPGNESPDAVKFPVEQFVRQYENIGNTAASLTTGKIALDSFHDFLLAWRNNPISNNLYNKNARELDLLIKLNYSKLLLHLVKAQGNPAYLESTRNDVQSLQEEANDLATYLSFYDSRNMPEFPAGDNEYIAKNHYFLMGDNRYNSLDLRHSYDYHTKKIDAFDPYSVLFFTRLEPQTVDRSLIIGNVLFRYWPPSRLKGF